MKRTIIFIVLLGMSGCTGAFDPFERPGNWAETGAANETIAQQTANPADLIEGHGEPTSNGIAASAAIDKAMGANGTGTAAGLQTAAVPVAAADNN